MNDDILSGKTNETRSGIADLPEELQQAIRAQLEELRQAPPAAKRPVPISQAQRDIILALDYARRAQHMSMEQLAKQVGMKAPNLSRVWSYKANPGIVTLLKIAEVLNVNIIVTPPPASDTMKVWNEH